MKEQKKTIPLALALCVAAAVVNYSSLLGIITGLPRSFSGGVLGIIGYLANAVITFAPLALAVLLWQHRTKNQRKPVRIVCIAAGAAYLVRILLIVVNMARYGGFTLDSVLTNLFTLLPMVICMYMCLWAGSCIKKWMVKRGLGYFLVLGGGTFILLLNMVVPMFMSISVPVRTALLTYFPALIMLYLPDTIIAPDKAKPVTQTSAVVLVIAAFVILFILPSTRGLELHSNDSSDRKSTRLNSSH